MEKTEKVFAEGFMFKMKPDSPEWVVGSLSLKADEAIAFIQKNTDKGWVNLNVNIGKSGKPYVELDTWKPKQKEGNPTPSADFSSGSDLPF
jgi:hypothetical protein